MKHSFFAPVIIATFTAVFAASSAHADSLQTVGDQYSLPGHSLNPRDTIDVSEDAKHHVICYTARASESISISCVQDPTYSKK